MAQALLPIRDYGPALLRELVGVHERINAPGQLIWGASDRVFRYAAHTACARNFEVTPS